jgi:hypothetical protein
LFLHQHQGSFGELDAKCVFDALLVWFSLCCRAAAAARAAKKGRKRNLALLSFGDQAEEEEAQLKDLGAKAKIK